MTEYFKFEKNEGFHTYEGRHVEYKAVVKFPGFILSVPVAKLSTGGYAVLGYIGGPIKAETASEVKEIIYDKAGITDESVEKHYHDFDTMVKAMDLPPRPNFT